MDVWELIRDEGEKSGIEKGKAEGQAAAVLRILAAREVSVPELLQRRIQEERDLSTLDRRLVNALTATVADAVEL